MEQLTLVRHKNICRACILMMFTTMLLVSTSCVMTIKFTNNEFVNTSEIKKEEGEKRTVTSVSGIFQEVADINNEVQTSSTDNGSITTGSSLEPFGVINEDCGIYELPDESSEQLGNLYWGDFIYYTYFNDDWYRVELGNEELGYFKASCIDIGYDECEYDYSRNVIGDKRKSYMDYRAITNKSSDQYQLQQQAVTDADGIRTVHDRYLVAIGNYYGCDVGQYIDVHLADDTVLYCMVGDIKRNIDTNENNSIGNDGSAVEFIVDTKSLPSKVRQQGDCSEIEDLHDQVDQIYVYDKNLLEE